MKIQNIVTSSLFLLFAMTLPNQSTSAQGLEGPNIGGSVYAIATDGNDVYVGGSFSNGAGNQYIDGIARWDGFKWHALGTGLSQVYSGAGSPTVYAIFVKGNNVYIGGNFKYAGGVEVNNIARWNGSSWSSIGIGPGLGGIVYALAASDTTSDVYALGEFDFTPGPGAYGRGIVKWTGSQWTSLGRGLSFGVADPPYSFALAGSDLYVPAGIAWNTDGSSVWGGMVHWDGTRWSSIKDSRLGGRISDSVRTAAADKLSNIYIGGDFQQLVGYNPFNQPLYANSIVYWDRSNFSSVGSTQLPKVSHDSGVSSGCL